MRTRCWLPLVAALVTSAGSAPVAAQPGCDAPVSSTWLGQSPRPAETVNVDRARVHPVTRDLPAATAMLRTRHALALPQAEVARFAGPGIPPPPPGLRPYLVRAVFPTPNPQLQVRWSGNDLHVSASGLGCAPFTDHPIIVFLDRDPAAVFVTATAAL